MRRSNVLVRICVVLVLAIAGTGRGIDPAAAATELPLRTINVTLAKDQREQYVDQVRKFADSYAFAIRVAQSSPNPDHVLVQLWREDAKLISVIIPDRTAQSLTYFIGIYGNGDHPLPTTAVDQLVEGLRHTVSEIEGVTFSVTQ